MLRFDFKQPYVACETFGNELIAQKRFEEALLLFEAAKDVYPAKAAPTYGMGLVYFHQDKKEEAVAYFEKALKHSRGYLPAFKMLARLNGQNFNRIVAQAGIRRNMGKIKEAQELYEVAMDIQLSSKIFNRTTTVQRLINAKKAQTYLEIGVLNGFNFLQIQAPRKIAIDPLFKIPGKLYREAGCEFYEVTSDSFFENDADKIKESGIDIAFIDGMHTFEQSYLDVINCLKYLNPGGVILMHDCCPTSASAANPNREEARKMPCYNGWWMGDVWKTPAYLRAEREDLRVFVIDEDFGLGVVTRGQRENPHGYTPEQVAKMTYEDYISIGREKLLDLKQPADFDAFDLATFGGKLT